jgi:hypothetical protein
MHPHLRLLYVAKTKFYLIQGRAANLSVRMVTRIRLKFNFLSQGSVHRRIRERTTSTPSCRRGQRTQ